MHSQATETYRRLFVGRNLRDHMIVAPRAVAAGKTLTSSTCSLCGAVIDVPADAIGSVRVIGFSSNATCSVCCPQL